MVQKKPEAQNVQVPMVENLNNESVTTLLLTFIQQKKKHLNQLHVDIFGYEVGNLDKGNIRLQNIGGKILIPKIEIRKYHLLKFTVVSKEDRQRTPLLKIYGIYLAMKNGKKYFAPLTKKLS